MVARVRRLPPQLHLISTLGAALAVLFVLPASAFAFESDAFPRACSDVEPDGDEREENEEEDEDAAPPLNLTDGPLACSEAPAGNPEAQQDSIADLLNSPFVVPATPGTDTSLCLSWEMTATSDPNNAQRLAFIQGSSLGVSTNGGTSFTVVSVANSLPMGWSSVGDGVVAYDRAGRMFVTMLGQPNGGPWQVWVGQRNPVTGVAIGAMTNVSAAMGVGSIATSDKPWIAADSTPGSPFANRLYVTWSLTGGAFSGAFEVWGAYSTNQGANWTQMVRNAQLPGPLSPLNASDGRCWPSHVAVGANGDVYVGYHSQTGFLLNSDGSTGPPDGISGKAVVLRSTDGGATFPQRSEPLPAGQSDITFNIQSNETGVIPDARFWLTGSLQPYILPDPATACKLHVVSADDPDNDPTSGDASDAVMATSTNCGVSWALPQRVNDGPAGSWQLFPTAAIDPISSAIAVSWLDNRNAASYPVGSAGNARADLRVRYSLDDGVSWLPSLIVNDAPIDPDASTSTIGSGLPPTYRIGEYMGVTFSECAAHMWWPAQSTCDGVTDTFYDVDEEVSDFDPPEIECPPDADLGCNDSTLPAVTGEPITRDDCVANPDVIHVDELLGGNCPPSTVIESIDRHWSAIDESGNISGCTQHITITDFDAPVITVPQPLVLECSTLGGVPPSHPQIQGWLDEGEALDQCSAAELDVLGVPSLFPVSCIGAETFITFAAADVCGNSGFQVSTIEVVDMTLPDLDVPPAHTFQCTQPGGTPVTHSAVLDWLSDATASDVCSAVVLDNDAPALLPAGCPPGEATPVEFSATDACGNEALQSALAIVIDSVGPVLDGPVPLEVLVPPDHEYVCFDGLLAAAEIVDTCHAVTGLGAVTCTSSQCDDAPCAEHPGENGDGSTINDCTYDVAQDELCARAERAETDPAGRLYEVKVSATDTCGTQAGVVILNIFVPHSCTEGDLQCIFLDGFESGNSFAWSASAM